jgi:hypothetical protein
VSFKLEREIIIGSSKDRGRGDSILDGLEGSSGSRRPGKLSGALGKVKEGTCMVREVLDEPSIEVGKTQERLDFFPIGGGGPLSNSSNFDRIHLDSVLSNDKPKVLNACFLKLAFLQAEAETMFL